MKNFRKAFYSSLLIALISSAARRRRHGHMYPGVGDDANPCSRAAPCRTFAGAITKTSAGGEINALDPGGFGAVIIRKSITIDGTGILAGTLAAGTTASLLTCRGKGPVLSAVRLRGLSINGLSRGTNGINIKTAGYVSVEDCVIDGFKGSGIRVGAGKILSETRRSETTSSPVSL